MDNVLRDDLMKIARRISNDAENVRRVHNEINNPLNLSQALDHLRRAESLIIETANF